MDSPEIIKNGQVLKKRRFLQLLKKGEVWVLSGKTWRENLKEGQKFSRKCGKPGGGFFFPNKGGALGWN